MASEDDKDQDDLNIWGLPSSGSGSSSALAFSSYCCTREPSS